MLQSMDWVKRKRTTGKIEPSLQLLPEKRFTFQKSIVTFAYNKDIPGELIVNLDQTPLFCVIRHPLSSWEIHI